MPGFDGTGPLGLGPGTGWGRGPCGGGAAWRRGRRFLGRGFLGRRFWGYSNYSKKDEAEMLSEEAEFLKQELKAIEERLKELKSQK